MAGLALWRLQKAWDIMSSQNIHEVHKEVGKEMGETGLLKPLRVEQN